MTKIHVFENEHEKLVVVHCPGCNIGHPFRVRGAGPRWDWNEDADKPTFTPSMLVNKNMPTHRCHSFVTDGQIRFLNDCYHDLAGKTVELPMVDEDGDPLKWQCDLCDEPHITVLDGDQLCQKHADEWVKGERPDEDDD